MSDNPNDAAAPAVDQNELYLQRSRKLEELLAADARPFGAAFPGTMSITDLRAAHAAEPDKELKVRAAGRLVAFRVMGKSIFADIKDEGGRIQVYAKKNDLGDEVFEEFKHLDIGDIIGVDGGTFITRMGELTISLANYTMLSKSLRPLPEKWHGLTDVERRYRQRYLDLIVNDDSRELFRQRSRIVREIRAFLDAKGFMEVETPMMQPIPGGAAAKPFETYYEALRCKMFMRIAPELYLKRLLVGGFEKVFEMNRNFRNEGLSRRHNPEFTMIEIYQAYGDCATMMELVEELVTSVAEKVFGTLRFERADGKVIDLTRPWRRTPYRQLVESEAGADWFSLDTATKLEKARGMGLDLPQGTPDFEISNEIYEKRVEPTLIEPTFVTRLPRQLVPLAKCCEDDPELVDVFELEMNGQEIAPGYSELNDPLEQRRRFLEQAGGEGGEGGIDEDFLLALEHGMPPAGGMGIGIDRLVMTLTGAESIRDVILFPQLRPRG